MTKDQLNAAAKVLAECMDYPWEYMPEQGRQKMRDHAASVIAAAQPAAPAVVPEDWQPIETAPKDGTTVLLWEEYSDAPVVGHYNERRSQWCADKEHYDTNGDAIVVDKLVQDLIGHWMPIPTPPEGKQS
jgi:hypothetical protein